MTTHPWHAHYPSDVNPEFNGVNAPLTALFDSSVAAHGEKPALNFFGKRTSYQQLSIAVRNMTAALQAEGIGPGDRVGICLPNCPQFVIAYYAILKAGATVVNFNPLYTADELAYQITDSEIKLMFTLNLSTIYPKVKKALRNTPLRTIAVTTLSEALPAVKAALFPILKHKEICKIPNDKHHRRFATMVRTKTRPTPVDIDPATDLAVLQYTGGTTGVPKGAMLTHRNLYSNTVQVRQWLGEPSPDGERFLAILPFFHVFAMTGLMNLGLSIGAELIMLPKFELNQAVDTLKKYKPTFLAGVPTLFNALLDHPKICPQDFEQTTFCISGGAPLPGAIKRRFEKITEQKLLEGYGMTECSPVAACSPRHTGGKAGSVGVPMPGGELEIRDQENPDKKMPIGEVGEVFIRGPQVMVGYWKKPEATAETLYNGWLRTGDLGYMDADGFTFLTDRAKDLIIVNGYNVYPSVIEKAFYRHPDVQDAAAIAIADPHKGEVPKLYISLRPGATTTKEDLMTYALGELNPLERPAVIEIRDELPKTMVGKLDKKPLKAENDKNKE